MRIISGKYRGKKLKMPSTSGIRPTQDRLKESLFNIISHHYHGNLAGGYILDLFAGSGALGIECLSREAQKVVFIDNNIEALALIKKNIPENEEIISLSLKGITTDNIINANKTRVPDELGNIVDILGYRIDISKCAKHLSSGEILDSLGKKNKENFSGKNMVTTNFSGSKCFLVKGDSSRVNLEPLGIQFSIIFIDPPYYSNLVEDSIRNILAQGICSEDCLFVVESNREIVLDFLHCEVSKKVGGNFFAIYKVQSHR